MAGMKLCTAFVALVCLAAVASAQWTPPAFCKGRDCPRFELLRQGNGYDVRHYEAAVWVYTDVRDIEDEQEATMMGYARLARYFNGENEAHMVMPMTAPVAYNFTFHDKKDHKKHHNKHQLEISPLEKLLGWQKRCVTKRHHKRDRPGHVEFIVKMYLPYIYQAPVVAQPPQPLDKDVKIDCFPEWTAHVRAFDGFPTHHRIMHQLKDLRDALDDQDEEVAGDWGIMSAYDDCTVIDNRHQEILLPAPDEHKKKCTQHKAQLSVWESVFAAPRWALRV